MRYRFTAGAALLGALALSLTAAMAPAPAGTRFTDSKRMPFLDGRERRGRDWPASAA